jgi:hypothetical protein
LATKERQDKNASSFGVCVRSRRITRWKWQGYLMESKRNWFEPSIK